MSVNRVLGERPIIYTDSIGEQVFSLLEMDCDIENIHDSLYDHADPENFAISKFYTYKELDVPFVHFDLDIIFESDISDSFKHGQYDIFGFCAENVKVSNERTLYNGEFLYLSEEAKEKWTPSGPFYSRNQDRIDALNCCILYVNNKEFLDMYIESALQCYTCNDHIPRSIRANWDVVSEQQLLTNLLLDHNVNHNVLMKQWPVMFSDLRGIITTFSEVLFKRSAKNKSFLVRNYYNTDIESATALLKKLL